MAAAPGPHRRVHALLSDLVAEEGELEVVRSRHVCEPREYETAVATYEAFGRPGGATAWITDADGDVLLVRPSGSTAWTDPGTGIEPGESHADCARRAVSEATGLEADLAGVERLHLRYLDDWADRTPVPVPVVVYRGRVEGTAEPEPGPAVAAARFWDSMPDDLLYEALADLQVNRGRAGDSSHPS
jgi:ADP-ribose pyrophosphatase YjhB (NUDIX family)